MSHFYAWAVGECVPDFFPIWDKKCALQTQTEQTAYTHPLASRLQLYNVRHRVRCRPPLFLCLLRFLSFPSFYPSPALSLIWPISRLTVTLYLHESQCGSRVLWTAAEQATTGKPSGLFYRIVKCSVHTTVDR